MTKGASHCEIRTLQELPNRIYPSASKTRHGNEAFVNDEGKYFEFFRDMLIVKTH